MDLMYSIIIGAFAIFTLIFGLAFSMVNYQKRHKAPYAIRNMFPFEFNYQAHFVDNMLGNSFLMISGLSLILFYGTFKGSRTDGYTIFILIAAIISTLLVCASYFVSTRLLKVWMLGMVLGYTLIFMLIAITACLHFKYFQQTHQTLNLIGLIFSIVLAVFVFALAMNPKLSFRIKAKEKANQDPNEEKKYERPKWIPLTFSIWMVIFALYINEIGIILFAASIS